MSNVKLYTILVILILLGQTGLLSADETPISSEGSGESFLSGTYTGFVETTYDDPDWVLVISDAILRENICESSDPLHVYDWYEKVFEPCYWIGNNPRFNRYWKLSGGAKRGRAFPMSAFGDVDLDPGRVGTLDSIYVREGFGFQLYTNTEEPIDPNNLVPASLYLGGARYVSLTCWRDTFPPPDGFEPGTLFMSGSPGGLKDYSIIVCRYPLRLHKTGNADPNGVEPEDYITYEISYENQEDGLSDPTNPNSGPQDLNNVIITDVLQFEMDFISASGNGDYNSVSNTVTWNIGYLPIGDSCSLQLNVKVNECSEPNGTIINFCEIESDDFYTIATSYADIGPWHPDSNIIYVNHESPHPPGTGMSWRSAYSDLQDALERAKYHGSQIWVAKGTYYTHTGSGSYDVAFELVNGVDVYGGFAGYETSLNQQNWTDNETILEGDIDKNNSSDTDYMVKATNLSQETVLDGFIIRNGYDSGIRIDGSSLNIANCHVQNNGSGYYERAGVYCTNSSVDISNCLIEDNNDYGIYFVGPSLTITDSYIIDNGNTYLNGGGLYNNAVSATITNCTFSGNSTGKGGGIFNYNPGSNVAKISNCIFGDNMATVFGGGIYNANLNSSSTIKNCIFFGNTAGGGGGGIENDGSSPTITNCTFSDNTATNSYGGGIQNYGSSPTLTNCIFWNNHAVDGNEIDNYDDVSTPTFNYCDIQGGLNHSPGCSGYPSQGSNNIDSDPRFVDASNNNYHLSASVNSPCIDAGDLSGNYDDQTDLDGEDRLFDGDDNGTKVVDMGADEYYLSPADYDGNGIVDLFDYARFANAWQTEDANFSLDDDNDVDMLDLRLFSKDWLWQPAWEQPFSFGCGLGMGEGLVLEEQSATQTADESTTQMADESVQSEQVQAEQAEPIELTPLDIDQMAEQLEDIWQQDDGLSELITESQWQDFLDSLNPD